MSSGPPRNVRRRPTVTTSIVRLIKIVTYSLPQFETNRKDMRIFTIGSLIPSLKRREDKLKRSKKSLKSDIVQTNKKGENSNTDVQQKRRLLQYKMYIFKINKYNFQGRAIFVEQKCQLEVSYPVLNLLTAFKNQS